LRGVRAPERGKGRRAASARKYKDAKITNTARSKEGARSNEGEGGKGRGEEGYLERRDWSNGFCDVEGRGEERTIKNRKTTLNRDQTAIVISWQVGLCASMAVG
jgi:hypothetical protein